MTPGSHPISPQPPPWLFLWLHRYYEGFLVLAARPNFQGYGLNPALPAEVCLKALCGWSRHPRLTLLMGSCPSTSGFPSDSDIRRPWVISLMESYSWHISAMVLTLVLEDLRESPKLCLWSTRVSKSSLSTWPLVNNGSRQAWQPPLL